MNKSNQTQFEINLYPVISLLSVLICFLLLSTIWVQYGEVDITSNSLNENTDSSQAVRSTPRLLVTSLGQNKIQISAKGIDRYFNKTYSFNSDNFNQSMTDTLNRLKDKFPEIELVLVRPNTKLTYQQAVLLIDVVKQGPFENVGLESI